MSRVLIVAITGTVIGAFFIASGIYTKKYKKSLTGAIFVAVGALLGIASCQKQRLKQQEEKLEQQKAQIIDAMNQMQEIEDVQNKLKKIREQGKPKAKTVPDHNDSSAINDRLNKL